MFLASLHLEHIEAGKGMKIYELLHLNELDCQVAIITNAKSKKTGTKDIIKINKLRPIKPCLKIFLNTHS